MVKPVSEIPDKTMEINKRRERLNDDMNLKGRS